MSTSASSTVSIVPSSVALRSSSSVTRLSLLSRHPAIGEDHGAGHEAGLVGGEEGYHVGDLARLARTADRLERVDRVVDLLEAAEHVGVRVVDRRVDPPRAYDVAADPLLRVVERDPPRQHHDAALRGRVDREEGFGDDTVDARDVHDRAAALLEH